MRANPDRRVLVPAVAVQEPLLTEFSQRVECPSLAHALRGTVVTTLAWFALDLESGVTADVRDYPKSCGSNFHLLVTNTILSRID